MERQERIFTFPQVFLTHTASAVGQEEHRGPLGDLFDFHDPSDRFGADTWEKAEGELHRTVMNLLLGKARLQPEEVDAVFAGDLQNQCVASAHGILSTGIPYMGLYGACSTCTEGLLCAALCMSGARELDRCVVLTTSHNCAAERQFRLPIEYGGQRTPTAQWTATAGGGILLGRSGPVRLARGMMGRLVDGVPLQESTHRAMDAVRTMIDRNRDKEDKYLGIPIETCLEVLDE